MNVPLLKTARHFLKQAGPGSFRARFAGEALGLFAMKIALAGLMFVITVILTRSIGAAGFGTYVYAITIVGVLVEPAVLGLDWLMVREVPAFLQQEEWGLMRGMLGWSNRLSLRLSLALGLGAAGIAWLWYALGRVSQESLVVFLVAVILLPFVALTRLRQAAMRGLFHVVAGQSPELLIQPVLLLVLVLLWLFVWREPFGAVQTTALHLASVVVAFVVGTLMLAHFLPEPARKAAPSVRAGVWRASALSLMAFSGMQFLSRRIDTLMLGALGTSADVGVYAAVVRGADLLAFILVAVNSVLAPTIVTIHLAGDRARLQRVTTNAARAVLLFSLVLALPLIMYGDLFLSIFGGEFVVGAPGLTILIAGRLFNAAVGSVALILTMTGHERDVIWGISAGAALNGLLNLWLIPRLGVTGAAIASASGMICWDVILTVRVAQRLGIYPSVLGRWRARARAA